MIVIEEIELRRTVVAVGFCVAGDAPDEARQAGAVGEVHPIKKVAVDAVQAVYLRRTNLASMHGFSTWPARGVACVKEEPHETLDAGLIVARQAVWEIGMALAAGVGPVLKVVALDAGEADH